MQSLEMGAIPAAVMLVGSLVTILSPDPPPKVVAHALQHLAAGIMICAISMELVPPMARAKGRDSIIGLVLGFSMGVLVMIGLSIFLEEAEEDDDGEESDPGATESEALLSGELRDAAADGPGFRPVAGSRLAELRDSPRPGASTSGGEGPKSLVGQAYSLAGGRSESGSPAVADAVAGGHGGRGGINGIREVRRPAFPWLFAFCVYVDSVMDGLLVGLALVTGNSAGVFMAAAMAVEMGFLGLTFAAACTTQPFYLAVPAVVAGPLCLVFGSALGGMVANSLAAHEPALVACTAFGVAALLYMVCEELLVSAHEEDDHVWWVDVQVFVGFLLAMLMDKLINTGPEHG